MDQENILLIIEIVVFIQGLDSFIFPRSLKFNRVTQSVYWEKRHLLFFRETKKELCKIYDIEKASVDAERDSDGSTYQTVIHLKDGKLIPLHPGLRTGFKGYHIKQADKINKFLLAPRGEVILKSDRTGTIIWGIMLALLFFFMCANHGLIHKVEALF